MKQHRKKIIDLKNLGPKSVEDFEAAGLIYADQLIKLGTQKAFLRMMQGRLKLGKSAKCVNAIYLYAIYGAIHDIDWMDIPDSKKTEFKELTKKWRKELKFY